METLFGLIGVAVLPWWISMLLFPAGRATRTLVVSPWPFVGLALVHALLLVGAVAAGEAPGGLAPADLVAFASGTWGALATWTHLVTANLFMGVWIFRDARFYGRVPRAELVLAWIAGPVGLGVYLWRRRAWSATEPVRVLH